MKSLYLAEVTFPIIVQLIMLRCHVITVKPAWMSAFYVLPQTCNLYNNLYSCHLGLSVRVEAADTSRAIYMTIWWEGDSLSLILVLCDLFEQQRCIMLNDDATRPLFEWNITKYGSTQGIEKRIFAGSGAHREGQRIPNATDVAWSRLRPPSNHGIFQL